MVRGTIPRQPSKFGRQAGVPTTRPFARGGVEAGAKAVRGGATDSRKVSPMKQPGGQEPRQTLP